MYRIDENTFIDGTLVTCAEYQLFIDEMREQGKYYQPDHWTSYQFLAGQARAPIVGVRFSDAKAFYEWLTQREGGEWFFRLPTSVEAEQYPLKIPVQSPLGYWIVGSKGETQFAWVGSAPVNPRNLDRALALNRALNLDLARDLDRDPDRVLNRTLALARDLDHNRDLYRPLDRARALALAITITRARDIDLARDLDSSLDRALDRALDLARALDRDIALARDLDRALAQDRDLDFPRIFDFPRDFARALARANSLDLYFDIYTLQERIAGRSPAFEGIRIVKERVR